MKPFVQPLRLVCSYAAYLVRGLPAVVTLTGILSNFANGAESQFTFDANGNFLSQSADITALPQILSHPQPQVVLPGALGSFFVVAANTRGLAYQWRFNGTDISGATNDALLLFNVGATNEGPYSVVLANSSGSVTSAPAALLLDGDRDGLPDSWELTYFSNLNQYPTGDSDGDGVSNLDEFRDDTSPIDDESVRYRLTILSDGGLVTAVPSQLSYTNGEVVMLTATAFAPNIVRGWTGDVYSTNSNISVVMTNNMRVFAHLGPLQLAWASTAGGDWNVATNWNPKFVPSTNDEVSIGPTATVTLNSQAVCRTLTLGSSGQPTLAGSGTLTVNEELVWIGGTMSGSGRTIIPEGGSLNVVNVNAVNLGRTLENGGTALWTGSFISMNGGVITNRVGALFETRGTGSFLFSGGVNRFDNAGVFRRSVSATTTTFSSSVGFNNSGVVEIQSGTLSMGGGGTSTGSFDVPTDTTLQFSGGSYTATAASSITGGGNLTVSAGNATLAGLVNLTGNHAFRGVTANLTGDYICTNNTLTISAGTAGFSGTGIVNPDVLNLSGGSLSGSSLVTIGTEMNWTGGSMLGSGQTVVPPNAVLNVSNANAVTLGRSLENRGTTLWTGSFITMNGGTITNRVGALFETRGSGVFTFAGGANLFDNAGTFRKAVSTAATTFGNISFNNSGMVDIQSGTLSLGGGGTSTGSFDASAGTTLQFSGGSYMATAESSLTGGGNLTVSAGNATLAGLVNLSGNHAFRGVTVNLTGDYICTNNTLTISAGTANFNGNGIVNPAVLNLSGGSLSGSSLVTIGTEMNWTGGTMLGSGRTVVPPNAALNVSNANAVTLGRTLENGGTVLWTGSFISMTSGIITNRAGALFETRGSGSFNFLGGANRFDNAGTFRKSVNTGTTTFPNIGFNNYGVVEIQSGILAANGGYTSTTNALLHCAIGGTTVGTGYGRLQVAGTVTLNGALRVALTNGFLPAVNDSFTVLTAGSRSGTFGNFYYPSNAVTMLMSNSINSVIVSVSDVLVVPSPVLHIERIAPTIARLYWSTNYTDFHLESNTSLSTSNWGNVSTLPVVVGMDHVVTNSTLGQQLFYRLFKP